jgi:hypothetical protein
MDAKPRISAEFAATGDRSAPPEMDRDKALQPLPLDQPQSQLLPVPHRQFFLVPVQYFDMPMQSESFAQFPTHAAAAACVGIGVKARPIIINAVPASTPDNVRMTVLIVASPFDLQNQKTSARRRRLRAH